ncbi:MAG: hypothetical protein HKN72_17800 [Gemmatimonadetes bacterium]|nr:hypothetical protein [Gemmatimonadota bacterium]
MIGTRFGLLLLASVLSLEGGDDTRLYGRVTTDDGRTVEGYFRWDRNEASRWDFLDAAKELREEVLEEAERLDPAFAEEMLQRRSIVAFGFRIRWDEDDLEGPPRVPASVRFEHVAFIEPQEGAGVHVGLVDGSTFELVGTTTDLGPSMRDLLVDTGEGLVEIDWQDVRRVDFLRPPPGVHAARDTALVGTVRTWSELELTGQVAWDRDEVFLSDVLDGREGSEDLEIPFREIVAIAPEGRRSAEVTLTTGAILSMRGTNDVDRGNRGLDLSVPGLGRILVPWGELESVRFQPQAEALPAALPIGRLHGTVYARDGRVLTGALRWGHDEEYGWEVLDGWHGDTEVDVEFGTIEQIRPDGPEAAVVVLADGRVLRLEDTDDVGEGHRGVFVSPDGGSARLVRWGDVDRVIFHR